MNARLLMYVHRSCSFPLIRRSRLISYWFPSFSLSRIGFRLNSPFTKWNTQLSPLNFSFPLRVLVACASSIVAVIYAQLKMSGLIIGVSQSFIQIFTSLNGDEIATYFDPISPSVKTAGNEWVMRRMIMIMKLMMMMIQVAQTTYSQACLHFTRLHSFIKYHRFVRFDSIYRITIRFV
jgi:hypothetical protein